MAVTASEIVKLIRAGAERLRKLASKRAHSKRSTELRRHAAEMDEHAAEIERTFGKTPPRAGKGKRKPKDNAKG